MSCCRCSCDTSLSERLKDLELKLDAYIGLMTDDGK